MTSYKDTGLEFSEFEAFFVFFLCYTVDMSTRLILLFSFILSVFLLAIMNWTTPQNIGSVGVFLFIIIFYLIRVGVAVALCRLFFGIKLKGKTTKKEIRRRSDYYGMILALAPMMLLMMQSFGGIKIFEIILVAVTTGLLCFLAAKRIL